MNHAETHLQSAPIPERGAGTTHPIFKWRDYQPKDLEKIGGPSDYAPWHSAMKEDCEKLMDRIAERTAGIDFTKEEGDPLMAMISRGRLEKIVTPEQAEILEGEYDPTILHTLH